LRVCKTYHGPIRTFVADRVLGVSSSVHRGHGRPGLLLIDPQNGQTRNPAWLVGIETGSVRNIVS
jgi:hypothetical protein